MSTFVHHTRTVTPKHTNSYATCAPQHKSSYATHLSAPVCRILEILIAQVPYVQKPNAGTFVTRNFSRNYLTLIPTQIFDSPRPFVIFLMKSMNQRGNVINIFVVKTMNQNKNVIISCSVLMVRHQSSTSTAWGS